MWKAEEREAPYFGADELKAAGIGVGELAKVLGVHRTTMSDLLSGKTSRPTPGAHAIVALWPYLPDGLREALLEERHSRYARLVPD
jgi:hypothetical protein